MSAGCLHASTVLTHSTQRQPASTPHFPCLRKNKISSPNTLSHDTGTAIVMTADLTGDLPPVCVSGPCGWPRAQEYKHSKVQSRTAGWRQSSCFVMLLVALQDVKATAHGLQQYSSIRAIFVGSGSGVIAGASNCSLLTGTHSTL